MLGLRICVSQTQTSQGGDVGQKHLNKHFRFSKWHWLHYVSDKNCFFGVFFALLAARKDTRVFNMLKERLVCSQVEDFATSVSQPPSLPTIMHLTCIWNRWECCHGLSHKPIAALLSEQAEKDQKIVRTVLELLFRSIAFLGCQGPALQGHNHQDGVLCQLMMNWMYDLPRAREWLQWRDNWMSDII